MPSRGRAAAIGAAALAATGAAVMGAGAAAVGLAGAPGRTAVKVEGREGGVLPGGRPGGVLGGAAAGGAGAGGGAAPPAGTVGMRTAGWPVGLGGRVMRTVSFFGCTLASDGRGGVALFGEFGMFSAIIEFAQLKAVALPVSNPIF